MRFKSVVCVIIAFAALFVIVSLSGEYSDEADATIYDGNCGDSLTWSLDTDTKVLTITGAGNMDTFKETTERPTWNSYKSDIKSVVIGSGVTSIGSYAFYKYTGLTSIDLSNASSLKTIEGSAFRECTKLESLDLSKASSLDMISYYAFYNCSGLTGNLTIPFSVTMINNCAFKGCSNLTGDLTIPSNVKSISIEAFYGCIGLTSLDLSGASSLGMIGDHAFYGCKNLTGNLAIPSGVVQILGQAFSECTGLTSLDLSKASGLMTIDNSAFSRCTGLISLDLSGASSLKTIGDSAFSGCFGLTSLDLSKALKLETIGNNAFKGCIGLTGTLTISSSLKTIGNNAFFGCEFDSVTVVGVCSNEKALLDGNNLGNWKLNGMDNGSIKTITIDSSSVIDLTDICGYIGDKSGKTIVITDQSVNVTGGSLYTFDNAGSTELTGSERAGRTYNYGTVWFGSFTVTYINGVSNVGNPTGYSTTDGTIVLNNDYADDRAFNGWYSDIGLTSRVLSFDSSVGGDRVFYASWAEIESTGSETTVTISDGTGDFKLGEESNGTVTIAFEGVGAVTINGQYLGTDVISAKLEKVSGGEDGDVYEFVLQRNGESIRASMQLSFEFEERDGYDIEIWYVVGNSEIEKLDTTVEGNVATATTGHNSLYKVKYVLIEYDDDEDDGTTHRTIRVVQSESSEIDPDIIAMVVIVIILLEAMAFLYVKR